MHEKMSCSRTEHESIDDDALIGDLCSGSVVEPLRKVGENVLDVLAGSVFALSDTMVGHSVTMAVVGLLSW